MDQIFGLESECNFKGGSQTRRLNIIVTPSTDVLHRLSGVDNNSKNGVSGIEVTSDKGMHRFTTPRRRVSTLSSNARHGTARSGMSAMLTTVDPSLASYTAPFDRCAVRSLCHSIAVPYDRCALRSPQATNRSVEFIAMTPRPDRSHLGTDFRASGIFFNCLTRNNWTLFTRIGILSPIVTMSTLNSDHLLYGLKLKSNLVTYSHPAIQVLGACAGLLLLWRLWRFTIAPMLWPNEPKPLPYWIPIIGHSWEFMHHSQALFMRGHSYFNTGEPYALTIAGQKMVVIQTTQEVATIWKQTVMFTFEPFVENIMGAFGFNRSSVKSMFQDEPGHFLPTDVKTTALLVTANPQGKCYFKMQSEWLKHQLHPADNGNLRVLQMKYAHFLDSSLKFNLLKDKYVVSSEPNQKTISLKRFTREVLGDCAMRSFFGNQLFETSPSFLTNYQTYEDDSWKIFFNYPRFVARSLHVIKDRALDDLVRYFALPKEERTGLAWIFQTLDSELTNLGLEPRDRAGIMMMITWAINHNAHKISFWVFAHILFNPSLLEEIRRETRRGCNADGSIDMQLLLTECPQLDAVWFEVLRIYNNAALARKATVDTVISNKTIHKNETIIGPFRQFHLNPAIFGEDVRGFDPNRFLANKNLSHVRGYYPFGGGNTYCPGRFFARSEIYIFVATALDRFNMKAVPGQTMPEVDLKVPSSSAMPATRDCLVEIKSRAKKN
ncbi:hypothetical protein G7Y89_g3382 [Cudoniella acicularis]|uniref:Cytochrome P450 n=1 Tax=Cudoniella acicularis TaxID=354080 RepID=A0A8H4RTG0_9HELO|nr:hypothetical protein G7Y89_g3382 [Cudoniella acicularis]